MITGPDYETLALGGDKVAKPEGKIEVDRVRRTTIKVLFGLGISGIASVVTNIFAERANHEVFGLFKPSILGDLFLKRLPNEVSRFLNEKDKVPIKAEVVQTADIDPFPNKPPTSMEFYRKENKEAVERVSNSLRDAYFSGLITLDGYPGDLSSEELEPILENVSNQILAHIDAKRNELPGRIDELVPRIKFKDCLTDNLRLGQVLAGYQHDGEIILGFHTAPGFAKRTITDSHGNEITYDAYVQVELHNRRTALQSLETAVLNSRQEGFVTEPASFDSPENKKYWEDDIEELSEWIHTSTEGVIPAEEERKIASSMRQMGVKGEFSLTFIKSNVDNWKDLYLKLANKKNIDKSGNKDPKELAYTDLNNEIQVNQLLGSESQLFQRLDAVFIAAGFLKNISNQMLSLMSRGKEVLSSLRKRVESVKIPRRNILRLAGFISGSAVIGSLLGGIKFDRDFQVGHQEALDLLLSTPGSTVKLKNSNREVVVSVKTICEAWLPLLLKKDVFEGIPGATVIKDRNGKRIFKYSPVFNRESFSLESLKEKSPKVWEFLKKAVLLEDKRFFEHEGFDKQVLLGITQDFLDDGKARGGSTLTQQMIKNVCFFLQSHPDIPIIPNDLYRKMAEVVLAPAVERAYEQKYGSKEAAKEKVLEQYLNAVSFGPFCVGLETAAQDYFSKEVSELTESEIVALFAIIPSPIERNPRTVTGQLELRKYFDASVKAFQGLGINSDFQYPYFRYGTNEYSPIVGKALASATNVEEQDYLEGLEIETTLDIEISHKVNDLVDKYKSELARTGIRDISLTIRDDRGNIIATHDNPYEYRFVGSASKPILVAEGLSNGYFESVGAEVDDSSDNDHYIIATKWGSEYSPYSYGVVRHGKETLSTALQQSHNVVFMRAMEGLSTQYGEGLKRLRVFKDLYYPDLPTILPLGVFPTNTVLMSAIPMTWVSGGLLYKERLINSINKGSGEKIYSSDQNPPSRVYEPGVASQIKGVLTQQNGFVIKTGTSTSGKDTSQVGEVWITLANSKFSMAIVGYSKATSGDPRSPFGDPIGAHTSSQDISGLTMEIANYVNSKL